MRVNKLKAPWINQVKQGKRYNPDPFYHSKEWKVTRGTHIQGFTKANDGTMLSNKYCIDCYNESKKKEPMHTVDHVTPIKLGGSRTDKKNLQSQCKRHHAKKSANEGKHA